MTMLYLHCRLEYGEFSITKKTTDGNKGRDDDFVTGLIDYTSSWPFECYSGFSEGSAVGAPGAAAETAVIPMADTSPYAVNDKIGVEINTGTFHKSFIQSVVPNVSITLTAPLPVAADAGNRVVSMSQLSGSTSGSAVPDYKADKARIIINTSMNKLEPDGIIYKNRIFPLGTDKYGNRDERADALYNRVAIRNLQGEDANTMYVIDIDGIDYYFTDVNDLLDYGYLRDARYHEIYGDMGGQSSLLQEVTVAANTPGAMAAIVDNRT